MLSSLRQYDVLGTRPVSTMLEMVAPKKYQAVLREQPYDVDPDTKNPEIASAWIGFSSSGEVTAPVVYAHSGNPEDYELLRQHGIDPSSGTASMMEVTRAFGAMLKQGIRPRRTLVFGSWDGEEVGLTGSTEWGEQFDQPVAHAGRSQLHPP